MREKIKRTFGFIFAHPLSGRHPVKSILRLLIWQMQSLSSPSKLFVKRFIGPIKFYARKGLTGITGNIYAGLHEFNDMVFLLHFLRPDDVFFDVGANVGSYTLLASGVCGAQSTAIEPVKLTFGILSKNIALNNLQDKVSLRNSGAGGEAGTLTFSLNEDTTNHVVAADEEVNGTVSVPVITVDSLSSGGVPALIKIDVEGYETEVLKGMTQTLASATLKAIIIELNGSGERYGFDENKIHRLLLDHGFNSYQYDAFKRDLSVTEKFGGFNTIYCRDLDFVNQRIKSAAGIKVMGEVI